MRAGIALTVVACLAAVVLVALGAGPEGSNDPRESPKPTEEAVAHFEFDACPFDEPRGENVECGYLTVPEDRGNLDGSTIELAVAIFRTASYAPREPVVYLAGGPGENALETLPFGFDFTLEGLLEDRDLVVFDQRGTGYSEPSLQCFEIDFAHYQRLSEELTPADELSRYVDAGRECRERLLDDDVNLEAYTSAESAADVDDLRRALGYDRWNLYGVSYGTKLALTVMRDFPDGVRSVVLDSVYPLQVDLYEQGTTNARRAFDALFEGCAQSYCQESYPQLESVFFDLVRKLDEAPARLDAGNPFSGPALEGAVVDGRTLIDVTFGALYNAQLIPLLPKMVFDARDGDYQLLSALVGATLRGGFLSYGMHFSVQCGEEMNFSSPERIRGNAAAHPELLGRFDYGWLIAICENWGAREAGPIENEPFKSNIPTLILSGEYDPITPPAWGRLAKRDLRNGYYLEFPGLGHGVAFADDCALDLTLGFLLEPGERPDGGCIDGSGPAFLTD